MDKFPKKYLFVAVLIIVAGALGWFARLYYANKLPTRFIEYRENSAQYHFINPLLFVDTYRSAPEFDSIKTKMNAVVAKHLNNGDATSISSYFRDINTGRWTGINEDETYQPSSMLKVLMMISYLKKTENDPGVLSKNLFYKKTSDSGQNYKPTHSLENGYHSIRDLIGAMITDSDNDALYSLAENNKDGYLQTYKVLQLPVPADINSLNTDFMSPKNYSSVFRTLYNATYLPSNISEQALELLTYTTFNKGLTVGVPQGILVAHKFGEHTALKNGDLDYRELHDCGIVYLPGKPYFLCVMTRGKDFSKLETIISDVSKMVYEIRQSK